MSPERWRQIKTILDAALDQPAPSRRTFVATECGNDTELRDEVESLLAAHEESNTGDADFLGDISPHLLEVGDSELTQEKRSPLHDETASGEDVGLQVGAWRLEREIGRGGMGVVYLAVRADSEFRKKVAVKLLRRGMETPLTIQRFRNERQILARLEHPNIARLIDGGTTSRSTPYFVMEYVEGDPLLKYVQAHHLSIPDRLKIFLEVCSAVEYAHRRMIVHRDLKPGNVLVKKDGTPKLLDFGIAKLLDPDTADLNHQETTLVGMRMVTPAYASPEQMRGEPATVRSDIYSLGIILCELVAGCKPSALPTANNETAANLHTDLRTIVMRATRYAPDERYGSVEDLSTDLQHYLQGEPIISEKAVTLRISGEPPAGSVAVLPFRIFDRETGSDAFLAAGITDAIITRLSNVGRIAVKPTSAILRYDKTSDAAAAGRALNVEYVVEGRLQRTAERVRVTVQLIPVRKGSPVWAGNFDEESGDLLKLEDSISGQVAQALIPHLTGEERMQLAKRGTTNARAHEAYLKGRWHWNTHTEEGLARALVCFSEAITADPQYAQAHAGIAEYYIQLGLWGGMPPSESFAAARQAALKAIEIDPDLAEARAVYGVALWAYDRDYAEAAHQLQLAITLNPENSYAHQWYGMLNSARGRSDIAIASLERARDLDPKSASLAASLARAYCNARQFESAVATLRSPLRLPEENSAVYELLTWSNLGLGRKQAALQTAQKSVDLGKRNVFSLAALAAAEAANGNRGAAEAIVGELEQLRQSAYVSPYQIASAMVSAGKKSAALDQLERSAQDRDWWSVWAAVDPRWDPLRKDPRFRKLAGTVEKSRVPLEDTAILPPPAKPRFWQGAAVAALAIIAALLAWTFIRQSTLTPFQTPRYNKLTTNGTAHRAAITPDGSTVVFTSNENGQLTLWKRPTARSQPTRLAGPFVGEIPGIGVTNDGRFVTFVLKTAGTPAQQNLYRVAIADGLTNIIKQNLGGPAEISPDSAQVAELAPDRDAKQDELTIYNADGSNRHVIATRKYPDRYAWTAAPAWSPDARSLAVAIESADKQGYFVNLQVVDLSGKEVTLSEPRFQYVERITWMRDGRGLFVIGQEHDSSFQQIWFIPLPSGAPRRISNDLNDYIGVSLTDDAKSLVSVQIQTQSNIYVMKSAGEGQGQQITPGNGRYFDLAWGPKGKLVYASDASGQADIWTMEADGSGQRVLTASIGRSYAPNVARDGSFIVFHSNRDGNWNLWRIDADGSNLRQLTADRMDSNWPQLTIDGKFVIYHHTQPDALWNIWRVPINGGASERLTSKMTIKPSVNPNDGRIACWYSERSVNPIWKIAILAPNGGEPLQILDLPPGIAPESTLRWTSQGDGLLYVNGEKGISNLWVMPLQGTPYGLTKFTWGQIYSFDAAKDGRIAYSRGISTVDVVLIRDETKR